jgi:hypothetical protein
MVAVDEEVEVGLHLMLVQQLAERESVREVGLEVGHRGLQPYLIVQPAQQYLAHVGRQGRQLRTRRGRLLVVPYRLLAGWSR